MQQSQKASNIGWSVECGNCNAFSVVLYFQATLKKERKPLQGITICIVLCLLVSYNHLTSSIFDVYFSQRQNLAPTHSFLVRVQPMVWVLSGNREISFLSFHLKIDIFNFSLKLHSMTNNGSVLSGQVQTK